MCVGTLFLSKFLQLLAVSCPVFSIDELWKWTDSQLRKPAISLMLMHSLNHNIKIVGGHHSDLYVFSEITY